jgi:hypothetical protein
MLTNDMMDGHTEIITRDGARGHIVEVIQGDRMGVEAEVQLNGDGEAPGQRVETWVFASDQSNFPRSPGERS